jgi:succinyl-diaminopimelate desuccinylase
MIPDRCQASLDVRLVPGQSVELVGSQIREAALAAVQGISGASVKVNLEDGTAPFFTSPDSRLVQVLAESVEEVIGQPPTYFAKTGSSDANLVAHQLGIPVVAYGPGNTTGHAPDEYVEIEDLVNTWAVYILTAVKLLVK